jgi:electron transfer flavoprotein alpha/beta subunit
MAENIYVYIDHFKGDALPASWEAVGAARTLAADLGGPVIAIVLGESVSELATAALAHGADGARIVENPLLAEFRPEPFADAVKSIAADGELLIFPTSGRTRELAAMVAVDLETGVAPDVIALAIDGGQVVATRPIYAGKLLSKVIAKEKRPFILTLRSRAFPRPEADASRSGDIVTVEPEIHAPATEVKGYSQAEAGVSLTDAAVIVSGGRGASSNPRLTPPAGMTDEKEIEIWKAQQGFNEIEDLASVLGGRCQPRCGRRRLYPLRAPGRTNRQGCLAGSIYRMRNFGRDPASRRNAHSKNNRRHQQGRRGADLQAGPLRCGRRYARDCAGPDSGS